MHCPFCHAPKTQVRDSIPSSPTSPSTSPSTSLSTSPPCTRRKRLCPTCSASFSTLETPEENTPFLQNLSVLKRTSSIPQPLNLDKINKSLSLALAQKTSPKIISQITQSICQNLQSLAQQNKSSIIPSSIIASQITTHLRKQNFAAFLRFASAQQNLNSIQEIQELIASEKASSPK